MPPVWEQTHRIPHPVSLGTHLQDLGGGLIAGAGHLPDPSVRQAVKERKTEGPAIKEQQRSLRHRRDQGQEMGLAMVACIGPPLDAHPWVQAQIEQGTALSCQQV